MIQQEELKIQEDNVEQFHHRSAEIKDILHNSELPAELQVILPKFKHTCTETLISCSAYCS